MQHLFPFELREGALPDDRSAIQSRLLPEVIARCRPNLAVLCLSLNRREHAEVVFCSIRRHFQELPIVVAAQATDPDEWRGLLELGPDDFITPPFRPIDVVPRLWRLHSRSGKGESVMIRLKEMLGLKQLVGESPSLIAEINKIPLVARSDASVLIAGETGTGKEMFARAIHFLSPRSAKPLAP